LWRSTSDNSLWVSKFANIGSSAVPGWYAQQQLPTSVATELQPALASQVSDATSVLLAWKGQASTDLWIVPLDSFATVQAPSAGLGSASNYIFANSDCKIPLQNLSVTIEVTTGIVLQSNSPPVQGSPVAGFGFQLNAYSPSSSYCAVQQYVVALWGTELVGMINNWTAANTQLVNEITNLASVKQANVLPRGYKITISLEYDQSSNVIGAVYQVVDDAQNKLPPVPLAITGVPSTDLAPIIAFELDFVGPANGESAVLSAGAGTITYTASRPLAVANKEPPCVTTGLVTQESANTVYDALPGYLSSTIPQSFSVSAPGVPMIKKAGKRRPTAIISR
jgi:hypothetical protein